MSLIQNRAEQVLLSSLVILLTFLSIVTAQQSQSRPLPLDQKQTAQKVVEEPAAADASSFDKPDAKLAVYQVHRLADKILGLRSVHAKAFEIARLASVLWKHDEPHSRVLFEKA